MLKHRRNSTLAEKQYAIKQALVVQLQKGNQGWLSTNELAAAIGVARNGRFKANLDWMVESGTLIRREVERPGKWPGYEYALSKATVEFYFKPRQVNLKRHGKVVASMELWS